MKIRASQSLFWAIATAALFAASSANAQHGAIEGDWPHYAGDHGSTKYSPLDQITAENFADLEIAWRWESADIALDNEDLPKPYFFRGTPIVVDGVAYMSTGLSQVAAINAKTGETIWVYDPQSYTRGPVTHGMYHHRGVEYWTDGDEERIFISTGGRQLVSIDAKTGKPDPNFGDGGWVDLLLDLGKKVNARNIGDNKPPVVCGDTVIVGSIIMDFPTTKSNPPGHIRGYDVRTGKQKWIFHTIPQEGEYGNETWENESWQYSGNTNAWSLMTCDDELGYVYLPIGTPTSDYYGGHRHGDNLFAESLLCLDAETGERVWHFQAVHHGIWDYDFPCAPNLVDITVDGKAIKAVAQVSKQGFTYVFDRVTGEPVWPIEEREVNTNTTVPGEKLSPTQPFPTKPPAFERQGVSEDDLIDFTPELRAEALEIIKDYVIGPIFTPNIVIDHEGKKAMLQLPGAAGGANWPGASLDPETGILYVQSATNISRMGLRKMDPARSDLNYMISMGGMDPLAVQGLPLTKPPYRRITAIDLNKGEIAWQKPFGWGPVDHPLLKDLDLGPLGDPFPEGVIAEGGILLTKNVLVSFLVDIDLDGNAVMPSNSRLQAYDKSTGEHICDINVDRHLHGSPMTFMADGKQYIVVAGGGVKEPAELIAFALPDK